jgi:hypothetical protein
MHRSNGPTMLHDVGPGFPSLNVGGWKGKDGLTHITVWAHLKKPKSGFSPDWSIRKMLSLCEI